MMEAYLMAQQPAGVRMWQTRRAFYPAHVTLMRAQEERHRSLEKIMKNGGGKNIEFGPLEVHVVFPYMWPPDFEQYMIDRGPAEWKRAFDTWPANTAKALILMILSRPKLELYLESVVGMYGEEKEVLARRMFEVGLGRCIRQMLLSHSDEVAYYKLMNPTSSGRIVGLLPVLKHEHKHFTGKSNKWLEACVRYAVKEPKYSLEDKTPDEVFIAQMYCAFVTARADRWPECWAHSLSALDHADEVSEETKRRYMHDLFCLLAHSAGRCYIRSPIVFKALEHAHGYMHNLEHPWKRLLVLQDLLIHWGFFMLEETVFEMGMEIIPLKTDYYAQLVRQHLKALMHRVENILLYQHTRQKFHGDCDLRVCKKPQHLAYSFVKAEELTDLIDFWSRTLKEMGDREYYSGYVHMYTALRFNPNTLRDGLDHLEQAKYYFERCSAIMRPHYERQKDATAMAQYLSKNRCNTLDKFTDPFSDSTMMFNNSGAAEMLFRIVLLSTYYGTHFYTLSAKNVQKRVADYYMRTTQDRGYRRDLLNMCQTNDVCHSENDLLSDYPRVDLCMEKEILDDVAARCYWRKEISGKLYPFTECEAETCSGCGTRKKIVRQRQPAKKNAAAKASTLTIAVPQPPPPPPPPAVLTTPPQPLRVPAPPSVTTSRKRTKLLVATMSTGGRRIQKLTPRMLNFQQNEENNKEAGSSRGRKNKRDGSVDSATNRKRTKESSGPPPPEAEAAPPTLAKVKRTRKTKAKAGEEETNGCNDKMGGNPNFLPGDLPNSRHFLVYGGDTLNFEMFCFGRQITRLMIA